MKNLNWLLIVLLGFFMASCESTTESTPAEKEKIHLANKTKMEQKMKQHLDAVSNKDLVTLKSTMHPEGKMQLILPSSEIINGVDGFMNYHKEWFRDTTNVWTFETKILNSEVSENLGMAITEVIYREAERDGRPYFNRMSVSYVLKKTNNTWYVIKDHASSIKKSTDK